MNTIVDGSLPNKGKKKRKNSTASSVKEVDENIMTEHEKKKMAKEERNRQEEQSRQGHKPRKEFSDEKGVAGQVEELAADFAEKMKDSADKAETKAKEKVDKAEEKFVQIRESELNQLHKDLEEAKDRGLRALAELENYRVRARRDAEERIKYASMDLARGILPVWDNIGRALESAEKDLHPEAILDGLKMMHKQFVDVLKKNNIEKIDALHQPFDPNFHESIAQMPDEEYPAGTIIVEVQPGFKLHERVVRPTQVVLAAPKPAASKSAQKENDEKSE